MSDPEEQRPMGELGPVEGPEADRHETADEADDLEPDELDDLPYEVSEEDDGERELPLREHVLAALLITDEPYAPPVAELLTLGSGHDKEVVARRNALGIGQEHVGELVRMARDRKLHFDSGDDDPAVWAPAHATELLEGLDVSGVVDELVLLFDVESDWFSSSFPAALGRVGAAALGPVRAYLADKRRWDYGRTTAINTLEALGKAQPELRDEVVATLSEVLGDLEGNSEFVLSSAMGSLVELKADEALPLIRRGFEQEKLDEFFRGDWAAVQKELGIEPDPDDPLVQRSRQRLAATNRSLRRSLSPQPTEGGLTGGPTRGKKDEARKAKNKRKAAAASRKANKKKKRK